MPRDVSIMVSVKDGFSVPLSKAGSALEKVQRQAENMGGKIDELNKKKAVLTVDATRAKKELQEAKRAFDNTEESARRLENAQLRYDTLQGELKSVSAEARSAEKQLNSLYDTVERQKNRAGGISESQSSETGLLSKLGQAGASQLIGQVASEAAGAAISSAFGQEASTLFSSALSMGASGAAIGSMIAPGVGTAIGAAAGGLLGLASGATQNFQNRDEYFKSFVQDQYSAYAEEIQNSLTGGSETAASREQSRLAFTTLLGGEAEAESFLADLQTMAARTPFSQAGLEAISKNLIANGISDTGEQLAMVNAIGEAGSALGLSEQSMAEAAAYLGRMNSTGKTSLEYLIPLMERGIPAVEYLAENFGKSKSEIYDMVSEGEILGEEAARIIAAGMAENFGGSLEKQAGTYTGLVSTLEDAQSQLDAAMGEGYNEARKPAIQEQIEYLSGEGGEEMKRMYSLIGEFQASLENEKEKAVREAMEAVQQTPEYVQARMEDDGAEMGRLLMEAKARAEKEYMETDGYQTMIEAQTTSIEGVREALKDSYWDAGYELGQEFQRGILAASAEERVAPENGLLGETEAAAPDFSGIYIPRAPNSHASGLTYVPYDNYPALLHEGERVLTARENRAAEGTGGLGGVQVTVSGNSFTVREEADVDRIAEAIARKVTEAKELAVW